MSPTHSLQNSFTPSCNTLKSYLENSKLKDRMVKNSTKAKTKLDRSKYLTNEAIPMVSDMLRKIVEDKKKKSRELPRHETYRPSLGIESITVPNSNFSSMMESNGSSMVKPSEDIRTTQNFNSMVSSNTKEEPYKELIGRKYNKSPHTSVDIYNMSSFSQTPENFHNKGNYIFALFYNNS